MRISEMEAKARELRQLQALIEEAQTEAEALRDAIKAAMGDSESIQAGEYRIPSQAAELTLRRLKRPCRSWRSSLPKPPPPAASASCKKSPLHQPAKAYMQEAPTPEVCVDIIPCIPPRNKEEFMASTRKTDLTESHTSREQMIEAILNYVQTLAPGERIELWEELHHEGIFPSRRYCRV